MPSTMMSLGKRKFLATVSYLPKNFNLLNCHVFNAVKNISDEDSSDDDVSTDEELVNPEFDKEFFNALAYLKRKDDSKYQKIPSFFKDIPTVEETVKSKQQSKSQKPVTVADHQRDRLIKTKGLMSDEENDDSCQNNIEDLSYVAEQEKIKSDLKKALSTSDDEEGGFLQVRSKTSEELQKEQNDYKKWLLDQKDSKNLNPLKDFWTSNQLSSEDKFLRDYILNQRYLENGDESTYRDIIDIDDDEAEIEKQAEYEHKYNFRFEEPDNEFIKRFPRKIDDSVRIEDTKRKDKRKEREERKAKEKEVKMKELRELQNIRKREIEEKLLLLKDVSGRDDFQLKEDDLNSDFDPDEHDRRMEAMFNNEYYGIDEDDQKPEFPDIDEELNIENWDNFDLKKVTTVEPDDNEPHCEDDDFNMDCDYDPQKEKKEQLQKELIDISKGRKRKKKISKLAEIIKKEKPSYDPSTGKTYAEYLDEYYKLDYEDIIGDTPCRFNYVECVPNDFGLSVEEILIASNKELNQWASLKKTMQNRPKNVELNDVEKYNRKRNNIELKKKIFKSMFGETSDAESDAENHSNHAKETEQPVEAKQETNAIKKKKKKKNKKKTGKGTAGNLDESKGVATDNSKQNNTSNNKQQKTGGEEPEILNKKAENQSVSTDSNSLPTTNGNPQKPHKKKKNKKPPAEVAETSPKVPQNNKPNPKKRKLDTSTSGDNQHKNNFKKRKFDNKQNWKQQNAPEIGDSRLKAFGINPKKFKNKIKYGGKNNNQQKQQHNKKNQKFSK